ncbi:nthranilate phosphoribosyltransferase [Diaporthe amygdali]|uniref:nthranilate phosphoribosyltransferase n=1 Tax=Phomopsis amygdali TaxID=1214568 RepID=UPI0022FEB208|nr:nthranilate phosphoribosyltransferase [Diaporthe amygdali]KAJ0104097.1 nthranilate phosphoribosyltransferase [Diaporthe amygdali]
MAAPTPGQPRSELQSESQPDLIEAAAGASQAPPVVDIKPLLSRLWPRHPDVTAAEISDAIEHFFTDRIDDVQTGALLMCLHFTGLDRDPDVLSQCARKMLRAAAQVDSLLLQRIIQTRGRREGSYTGGFCDIVGTGGDSHNTFNISTTASILASSLLLVSKHGNRASTSKSGSADLIANMRFPTPPDMAAVQPDKIAQIYSKTNYAFLFAPSFHPGMRFVSPVRRKLPWRTIFNLLGPLANPMDVHDRPMLEARVIGVARRDLGPVFAEALRLNGVRKAMVVCGDEELDEVSCAGPTLCWRLAEDTAGQVQVQHFKLAPEDFGLSRHPLDTVSPGKEPAENAKILKRILKNELADDDPILEFVLINTAALFVVSGVCDADSSEMGHGDDGIVVQEAGPGGGRWKEGVRRARWAVKSGEAWRQWDAFVQVTNDLNSGHA